VQLLLDPNQKSAHNGRPSLHVSSQEKRNKKRELRAQPAKHDSVDDVDSSVEIEQEEAIGRQQFNLELRQG